MINFSAIPYVKKSSSPLRSLMWAIIVTVSILSIMGMGALVTARIGHRDTIMPLISAVMILIFIGVVITALFRGFQGFKKQKLWMREFAKDNNWHYEEKKRTLSDLAAYPPMYAQIASSWNNVRCTVSGKLDDGTSFELAHITYAQSTGLVGALSDNLGSRKVAWTSVLRLEGNPQLKENPNFIYENDGRYSYVICGLNALYRHDIQAMFESMV